MGPKRVQEHACGTHFQGPGFIEPLERVHSFFFMGWLAALNLFQGPGFGDRALLISIEDMEL